MRIPLALGFFFFLGAQRIEERERAEYDKKNHQGEGDTNVHNFDLRHQTLAPTPIMISGKTKTVKSRIRLITWLLNCRRASGSSLGRMLIKRLSSASQATALSARSRFPALSITEFA